MYIYILTNLVNGKYYVGQTTRTVERRFLDHIRASRSASAKNQLITMAIRKYGPENFTVSTLEECECLDALNLAEVRWIKALGCMYPIGYNLRGGGDHGEMSALTRERMSIAKKGIPLSKEHVSNMANALRGRKLPDSTRQKMATAARKQTPGSFEARSACQAARFSDESQRVAMSKSVREGNLTFAKLTREIVSAARARYSEGGISQTALARQYNVTPATMRDALIGKSWK